MDESCHVKYARNFELKKKLLEDKKKVDVELKKCGAEILVMGANTDKKDFEIDPSTQAEIEELGEYGAVRIKTKKEYENMTRSTVSKLLCLFFETLMPAEDYKKAGEGVSQWLWANRSFKFVDYVERTYVTQNDTKKRKRKDDDTQIDKTRALDTENLPVTRALDTENLPVTREDFLEMDIFKKMQSDVQL